MADLRNGSTVGGKSIENTIDSQAKADKALNDAKAHTNAHIGTGGTAHATVTTTVNGFMSSTDKTKLDGISTNAKKVESSTTNGNIKIDSVETTVYTHPANHPASIITQDASNRFVTDTEKSTWNAKASTATATTTTNGLMSSTDKTKLDGVSTNAKRVESSTTNGNIRIDGSETTVYTHPVNHPASIITQDANNRFVTDVEKASWNDKYTKTEVDTKINTVYTNIDWKESVATFSAIATTYPSPVDGWTVNVNDTDTTYRYTGTEWIAISANAIPLATTSVDGKMSAADKAKLDGIQTSSINQATADARYTQRANNLSDLTSVSTARSNLGLGNVTNESKTTMFTSPVFTGTPTAPTATTGTNTTQIATTAFVTAADNTIMEYVNNTGDIKLVRLASTANIDLTTGGLLTIDGVVTVAGNRVLVKNQTTQSQNGIYVVATGAWTRATDHNTPALINASTIAVTEGSTQSNTTWRCNTTSTITVGATALTFVRGALYDVIAGTGLSKSGGGTLSLSNTGISTGTYKSVTVDAQGRVTSGTNPTTLAGYGITDAASSTHAHAFTDLTDVTLTSPTSGHLVKHNGTTWVNTTLTGTDIPNLDAAKITTGTVANARLTSASTSTAGIVQLNDTVTSTSTTLAATANSVKTAYDLANGKANATHTHTISNVTNLQSSLDGKLNLTGGTLTGNIDFNTSGGEKIIRTTEGHGMFLNGSGMGFYDWTNNRTVLSYNKATKEISIGGDVLYTPAKVNTTGNGHTFLTVPHSGGIDFHSTGNISHHYQTNFGLYTGNIGTGALRFSVDANGNTTAMGTIKGVKYESTSNGAGDNYKIGDDAFLGDVNASNSIRLTGVQNSALGYLQFGSGGNAIGFDGTHLKVGAHMFHPSGAAISWTSDIGDITASGWYRANQMAGLPGRSSSNPDNWWYIEHIQHDGSWCKQIAYEYNSFRIMVREKNGAATQWTGWRQIAIQNDWLYTDRVVGNSNSNVVWIGNASTYGYFDVNSDAIRMQYNNSNYIKVNSASVDFYFGGVAKHAFFSDGRKSGGSIEIDGHNYGMSPVDSPRTMIDDLITDVQLTAEGVKVFLDEKLSKAFDRYSIFPNNPSAIVIEKTATYFVVKGEGIADFIIRGIRRDTDGHYWNDMEHEQFVDDKPEVVAPVQETYPETVVEEPNSSTQPTSEEV